jgi:hypothetical protein
MTSDAKHAVEILRAEQAKAWAPAPLRWKARSVVYKLAARVVSNLAALPVMILLMTILISALDNGCEDEIHSMNTAQRIRCEEDWFVKHGLLTDGGRIADSRPPETISFTGSFK